MCQQVSLHTVECLASDKLDEILFRNLLGGEGKSRNFSFRIAGYRVKICNRTARL